MSRGLMERICEGAEKFRVWPDGTVQSGDEAPHTWMSDNFKMVWALNEKQALALAGGENSCLAAAG